MPTVLVISRYFPPSGSAGASIRLTKLIKYASQEGWEFIVLTQDADRPVIQEQNLSNYLIEDLPSTVQVRRIPNPFFEKGGFVAKLGALFGNSSLPWGVFVLKTGFELLTKHVVNLIFVNTPPFTNVAIGTILARLRNLPLFIDFKDDWIGSSAYKSKSKSRQKIEMWIEHNVILLARGVFFASDMSYESYRNRYKGKINLDKFHYVPNGIDLEEYHFLENRTRVIETGKFMLLTAASGYRKNYRDLTPFLEGLSFFLKQCPDAKNNIEVIFLGEEPSSEYISLLQKFELQPLIHWVPAVDRKELIEWLWKSDLLFLVQPKENYSAVSGTLYEYWATGKAPILLISESGASSHLVIKNQIGGHFTFDQTREIAGYIESIYQAYQSSNPIWINRNGVEKFNRKVLARKMISIWVNQVSSPKITL